MHQNHMVGKESMSTKGSKEQNMPLLLLVIITVVPNLPFAIDTYDKKVWIGGKSQILKNVVFNDTLSKDIKHVPQ